jgi:hypothetical protein
MIRFSFILPSFLHRILPAWLRADLEQRSTINGTASRSFLKGAISVKAEQQD